MRALAPLWREQVSRAFTTVSRIARRGRCEERLRGPLPSRLVPVTRIPARPPATRCTWRPRRRNCALSVPSSMKMGMRGSSTSRRSSTATMTSSRYRGCPPYREQAARALASAPEDADWQRCERWRNEPGRLSMRQERQYHYEHNYYKVTRATSPPLRCPLSIRRRGSTSCGKPRDSSTRAGCRFR